MFFPLNKKSKEKATGLDDKNYIIRFFALFVKNKSTTLKNSTPFFAGPFLKGPKHILLQN